MCVFEGGHHKKSEKSTIFYECALERDKLSEKRNSIFEPSERSIIIT
jgi:hypothetical protein